MTTKRTKISFLPFNLLWCVSDFTTAFIVSCFFFTNLQAAVIATLYYMINVRNQVDLDYLKDQNNLK